MANYTIGFDGVKNIYAGVVDPKNEEKFRNQSECTERAIEAVRDQMVMTLLGGFDCPNGTSNAWRWKLKDGRTVELGIAIKNIPEAAETAEVSE